MILNKIKEKGVRWFLWRLKSEYRTPTRPISRFLVDGALSIRNRLSVFNKVSNESDLLYAVYDLEVAPITFNILEFLIDVEYETNKRGKRGFVVIFVPKENEPMYGYDEYDSVIDAYSKEWRFNNILLPVVSMYKKCKGTYCLSHRSDVIAFVKNHDVYPELYDGVNLRYIDLAKTYLKIDRPYLFEGIQASLQGIRYVQQWIRENQVQKPMVVITIRNSPFDKVRNSNINEWSRFMQYLIKTGYHPVIVPDTDNAFHKEEVFAGILIFRECAWNIMLRTALYEIAYLNFLSPNGPMGLAWANLKCNYIVMNVLPENSLISREEHVKNNFPVGNNFRWALPNQRLVYKPDTYENIVYEFERFIEDNES